MGVLRRIGDARAALSGTVRLVAGGAALAAIPAVVAVDLLEESVRSPRRLARAAAGLTSPAAVSGVRTVGTVVTGSDPLPGGRLRDLGGVLPGVVEPPEARHTPRGWAARGRVQVELPDPGTEVAPDQRRALRRQLERLDGVHWAAVNDVVGRVLVAFDDRRIEPEDVVGVIAAVQRVRRGTAFAPRQDHPADLEPLVAALVQASVDTVAVGVAGVARVLPVPALTRHATVVVALLDTQHWLKERLADRIGPVGAGLVFDATGALLHALTQSPTVPAINAAAAIQRALEMRARRQVWRRREAELCEPDAEDDATATVAPGHRPLPLPPAAVDTYRARLRPAPPPPCRGGAARSPCPRPPSTRTGHGSGRPPPPAPSSCSRSPAGPDARPT